MKDFILRISLAVIATSFLFILWLSPSTKAASAYDDVYRPTSNLVLQNNAVSPYYSACQSVDYTTNWASAMITALSNNAYNSNNSQAAAYISSFNEALANGRWAVSQGISSSTNDPFKSIVIHWTENTSLALAWNHGTEVTTIGTTKHTVVLRTKAVQVGGSDCSPYAILAGGGLISNKETTTETNYLNLFVYSDHLNLPSGYEGPNIPAQLYLFLDYIKYKIIDKVGEFTPKEIDKNKITKCTLFIDENPAVEPDDGEVSEAIYEINDCESTVTHQWSQYGTYYVRLELEYDDGVRQYTHTFTVDGRSYEGQFDDEGNRDSTAINYEDCSVYGADIVAGIGCHFRNFGKWLQALFVSLFVPAPGYMSSFFGELRDFFTSKLGFLFWPVGFAIDLVSAFFQGTSGTLAICNWSFGNVFGREFKLNFCSFEQSFPVQFNTARYIIQAFTVFALVTGLYREYRRILTRS